MAKALVTGATGFVGSHLVDLLLKRGWDVRVLVRETSDLRWVPEGRVELVYGEVVEPAILPAAVDGADVVFHAAGVVMGQTAETYRRVNAEGAGNVARAAAALPSPPRRLVLVSSLAAGGPAAYDRPRVETDPDDPLGDYGASKLLGETMFVEAAGAVPWTILRPPAVYGPRDPGFLVLARLAAKGWTPPLSRRDQPATVVGVRDLVEAILLAAESPAAVGKTYYVADPAITSWEEMGKLIAKNLGRRARKLPIPRDLFPWVGVFTRLYARVTRRPNPLPPDRLRELMAPAWTCDPSLIRKDLGFTTRVPLAEGVAEMTAWYRDEGWL